ncbi:MAG: hypothetical protein ACXVCY_17780 [Pseudobdellovibrionaceae bacterium]
MRFCYLALFLISSAAFADITLAPRYEYILGRQDELADRMILKSKLNANKGPFGIFVEGFGEFEQNQEQVNIRRSPDKGYLQEAYLEFKLESFYIRVGRQALRWSESWTVPSLDIWTGRRWNRLLFDPISEQLTHSTGASLSYAAGDFSLDLVGVGELADNFYPLPVPEIANEKNTSFGGRVKWKFAGIGFSTLAAQVLKKNYYGISANYALDSAVPKMEVGYSYDNSTDIATKRDARFATVGCDLFLGNFIILPQLSYFEVLLPNGDSEFQTSYYVSGQWNPNRHDVQIQFYQNPKTEDLFAGVSYGYNVTDYFTASGFIQNYDGINGLYKIYKEITGGPVVGVRFEMTGNLAF